MLCQKHFPSELESVPKYVRAYCQLCWALFAPDSAKQCCSCWGHRSQIIPSLWWKEAFQSKIPLLGNWCSVLCSTVPLFRNGGAVRIIRELHRLPLKCFAVWGFLEGAHMLQSITYRSCSLSGLLVISAVLSYRLLAITEEPLWESSLHSVFVCKYHSVQFFNWHGDI